jgi:hypothetical protein
MPTIRRFARAQPHLGGLAFRNTHILRAGTKAENSKKATLVHLSGFSTDNNPSFRKPES